jgi:hypothetical protein
MATEGAAGGVRRRRAVAGAFGLPFAGAFGLASVPSEAKARGSVSNAAPWLVAAWNAGSASFFGLGPLPAPGGGLEGHWRPARACRLPTRAHGVVAAADGTLYAAARRPGDWLLRWAPAEAAPRLVWSEPHQRFNGHLRVAAGHLWTTETALDTGEGLLVRRDLRTLAPRGEPWATHGRDPHDLLPAADGGLWVANGGLAHALETGRAKDRRGMDSSLVRLSTGGQLEAAWRLPDERLSIRHLATGPGGRPWAALQAEHDGAAGRASAPLVAGWIEGRWQAVRAAGADVPAEADGYAGDIARVGSPTGVAADDGWLLSLPRAGRVLRLDASGDASSAITLPGVCALAAPGVPIPSAALAERADTTAWALGDGGAMRAIVPRVASAAWVGTASAEGPAGAAIAFDNHALLLPPAAAAAWRHGGRRLS